MIRKIGMAASAAAMVLRRCGRCIGSGVCRAGSTSATPDGTVHCSITAKVKINAAADERQHGAVDDDREGQDRSCSSSGGTILGAIAKGKGSSRAGHHAGHVHGSADAGNDAVLDDDQLEG